MQAVKICDFLSLQRAACSVFLSSSVGQRAFGNKLWHVTVFWTRIDMKLTVLEKPSPVPKIKGRETQLRKRKTCHCSEKIKHNQSSAKQRRPRAIGKTEDAPMEKSHEKWKSIVCVNSAYWSEPVATFQVALLYSGVSSSICVPLTPHVACIAIFLYIYSTHSKSGECQVQTICFFARRDK